MEHVRQKMEQARLQRMHIKEQDKARVWPDTADHLQANNIAAPTGTLTLSRRLTWLAGGMILGGLTVALLGRFDSAGLQWSAANGSANRHTAMTELGQEVELLRAHVRLLTTSVNELKARFPDGTAPVGANNRTGPVKANPSTGTVSPVSAATLEQLPAPAAGSQAALAQAAVRTADTAEVQSGGNSTGPWIVNIASFPSKADAERVVADAWSKDISASLYQVTIKGTRYWRVHVHGFPTAAEAKQTASLIGDRLGIKDAWVAKR